MDLRIKEVMCNLKNYNFDELGSYKMDEMEARKLLDGLEESHFSEPEAPIDYRKCADAMMKMWIDNVITDGEYGRIMDKLNNSALAGHLNEADIPPDCPND